MGEIVWPRLLLIAGSGRDSGKTTLACRVIRQFKEAMPLVAFKISPHHHKVLPGGRVLVHEDTFYLAEETDPETRKDSSRMLAAGAVRSFFAVSPDSELLRVTDMLCAALNRDVFLVGESAGLRQFVKPGLFIFLNHADPIKRKPDHRRIQDLADVRITFDGQHFDVDLSRIRVTENSWRFGL